MFPRVVTTKRGDKTYRYLHLLESYREGKQVKHRSVGNLGNIDDYSSEEIERLILKLQEFLHYPTLGSLKDMQTHSFHQFGIPYVVKIFWDELQMSSVIQESLKDSKVEFPVAPCILLMVINRLIDPRSKLGIFHWLNRLYLPDIQPETPSLQHLYRAMDHLLNMKPQVERHIYDRLTNLLSLRLNLVFYDLTSSYFEGEECSLAEYGYSRDHRRDRKQITIGLLVTDEGLPIAHQVFSGNMSDKKTVPDALKRLSKEFQIKDCVFVGDRGMLSDENLTALQAEGYTYILGVHKRGRLVSDCLLSTHADVDGFTPIGPAPLAGEPDDRLRYREVPWSAELAQAVQTDDDADGEDQIGIPPSPTSPVRYILCFNPAKARTDARSREETLKDAEVELHALRESLQEAGGPRRGRKITAKGLLLRVAKILEKRSAKRYFDVTVNGNLEMTFARVPEAIEQESLRDGRFLIQTTSNLTAEEVIAGYKNLLKVEQAFRELKDIIELRPMFHRAEQRVKAHVFICVLAYLFEQWMDVLHERQYQLEVTQARKLPEDEQAQSLKKANRLLRSGRRILDVLSEIQVVYQSFLNKSIYNRSALTEEQKDILDVLKIPLPASTIVVK